MSLMIICIDRFIDRQIPNIFTRIFRRQASECHTGDALT